MKKGGLTEIGKNDQREKKWLKKSLFVKGYKIELIKWFDEEKWAKRRTSGENWMRAKTKNDKVGKNERNEERKRVTLPAGWKMLETQIIHGVDDIYFLANNSNWNSWRVNIYSSKAEEIPRCIFPLSVCLFLSVFQTISFFPSLFNLINHLPIYYQSLSASFHLFISFHSLFTLLS